ncbi:MAG: TetR family transcriptional regulator [Pseudomonadales bacterium]|nr:TetR family transcriptional regulator [Pseudomonadales bacterium]
MKRAQSETDKALRESQIISAGLDEFYQKGFAAARMDHIGKRAGVSKGTLYLYFPSKEALFEAIIKTVAVPQIAEIERILEGQSAVADTLDVLMQRLPLILRQSPLPKLIKVLIGDAFTFPELVTLYRESVIERSLNAVAAFLQRGVDSGEIQADLPDPAMSARLVIAPVLMSAIWTVVFDPIDGTQLDLEQLFHVHHQQLKRALGLQEISHD